jgi:Ca2+/Na+ antiporter
VLFDRFHYPGSGFVLSKILSCNSSSFNLTTGYTWNTAVITPVQSTGIKIIDIGFMLLTSLIILPLSRTGLRISLSEGALLLAGYIIYIYYIL